MLNPLKDVLNRTKNRAVKTVNEVTKEGIKMTIDDFEPIIKTVLIAAGLIILSAKHDKTVSGGAPVINNIYLYDKREIEHD